MPLRLALAAGAGEDRAALSGRPRKANADQYEGVMPQRGPVCNRASKRAQARRNDALIRIDKKRCHVFEVLDHLPTLRLGNGRVFQCQPHGVHPPVALRHPNLVRRVSHAQPRVPLTIAVVLRPAEILHEELRLVPDRFLKIRRKHRSEVGVLVDAPIEGARDSPEWLRAPQALEDGGRWGGIGLSKWKHAVS